MRWGRSYARSPFSALAPALLVVSLLRSRFNNSSEPSLLVVAVFAALKFLRKPAVKDASAPAPAPTGNIKQDSDEQKSANVPPEEQEKKLASARFELMELLETELPTPPSYDLDEDEGDFSLA